MEARKQHLKPERPSNAGVEEQVPELAQIEGARLLANEASDLLREEGFSDQQILEWAETYISLEGSGDLESFLIWIRDKEQAHGNI
jgi:hypothetical protein